MRAILRRVVSLVLLMAFLFLVLQQTSTAQEGPREPTEWIKRGSGVGNIQQANTRPFKLHAKMRILAGKEQMAEGTFDFVWNSPSQWREQLQLPGYPRLRLGGEHKYWLQRSVPFEILRVDQLDHLLDFSSKSRVGSHEKIGKMQNKKENGLVRTCVDLNPSSGTGRRSLCFDPVSGVLVVEEDSQPQVPTIFQAFQITRSEYSDFHDWAGHQYPYTMVGFAGKTPAVELHVEELSSAESNDPSLFQHADSAEEWNTCDSPDEAAVLVQQSPKYPEESHRSATSGVVQIYAVIETDGTLSHLAVITSAWPDMDKAALDAVSKWRYKPPACNGMPFRTHTIITTTFLIG